jgi:FAD synthase
MTDGPRVIQGTDRLVPSAGRLAIAVGVFDGLHRGHRHLLRGLVRVARAWDARPAVITFDHHPDEVLRGGAPPLLLDPDERLWRLGRQGVEVVVIDHFDERLRNTTYDVYVRRIAERVDLAGFVMTPDAAFGFERRGTPDTLAELGRSGGIRFKVAVIAPFTLEGRPVSSSGVRAAIAQGALGEARRLLGRAHAVVGRVDGPKLEFPLPVALPPEGDYPAAVTRFTDRVLPGRVRTTVHLGPDGLRLERSPSAQVGGRLRVSFAASLTAGPGSIQGG